MTVPTVDDDSERDAREWEVETMHDFVHGGPVDAPVSPPKEHDGFMFGITCAGCGALGAIRLRQCDSVHTCFICRAETHVRYFEDERGLRWEQVPK